MALIGKIRKNFWLVLIVLGMALASFVLMDILGSRNSGGIFNRTTVGEINGTKIDMTDFQKTETALFASSNDEFGRKNQTWNYLIEKSMVESASEKLGIGVSQEELMELQFGNNLSPIIQNNFRNQQTGQVDRQQLLQIKQSIDEGKELPAQFREFWAAQENQIIKTAQQDKISTMVAKAMYTPSWMAELTNKMNTEMATFDYVMVPFAKVQDTEIKLEDKDFESFLSENAAKYTNKEETRLVDYIVFDVVPSAADSTNVRSGIESRLEEFRTTTNDSLFAANNNGSLSPVFTKKEDLTGTVKDVIGGMSIGQVYGPFVQDGYYQAFKLVEKAVLPDSVKARHILRNVSGSDPIQLAAANKTIDSLMALLGAGQSFDSLAMKHSEDTGSSFKGGDLGTFGQGTMVKQFNDAAFIGSRVGGLYKITTQFGVHLMEVQKIIFETREPKYKMAFIGEPMIPSEATQNAFLDKATELMRKNRTIESLEKAATQAGLTISTSSALKANDYTFANLGSGQESRAIVKWAYKAAPGEVSPVVYTYSDNNLFFDKNYVVSGLKSIQKPGRMTVAEAKTTLLEVVKNAKKGEYLKSKITGTDLVSIAAQYGTVVDTASGVSFYSAFLPNGGVEPKVVAKIFNANPGSSVGPIVGNAGVYVAKLNAKTPSVAASDIPSLKRNISAGARSQASFRLWEAIKKANKIEDNRSRFF